MFIVLDGPDGAGKSTQADLLLTWLKSTLESHSPSTKICLYRDPGSTPLGEALRTLLRNRSVSVAPRTEALLYTAARSELALKIAADLWSDGIVICDRWVWSTIAYQATGLGSLSVGVVRTLANEFNYKVTPDLTFVLTLTPEQVKERCQKRVANSPKIGSERENAIKDRYESCGKDFYERVCSAYRTKFDAYLLGGRVVSIDGTLGVEEVSGKVQEAVMRSVQMRGRFPGVVKEWSEREQVREVMPGYADSGILAVG